MPEIKRYNTTLPQPRFSAKLSPELANVCSADTFFALIRNLFNKYYRNYDPYRNIERRVHPAHESTGIAVLVPCFGHASSILAVVQSILAQTMQPISIHVLLMDVDSQILENQLRKLSAKVHCIAHSRLLPAAARNYLKTFVATESHIIYVDADDPLTDAHILEELWQHREFDIVMPRWLDAATAEPIEAPSFFNSCYYSQTTALIRADFLNHTEFNERFIHGSEDTEFFVRAYAQGASIYYSKALFTRSGVLNASYWAVNDHGAYDLLYEHRDAFLPVIDFLASLELDVLTLTRLYYLAKLLRQDLGYVNNIYELREQPSKHALWLMRSLSPTHFARQLSIFYRLQLAWLNFSRVCSRDMVNNAFNSIKLLRPLLAPTGITGVSVIIPCYGQSMLVAQAVQSVLAQTRVDLVVEVLVLLMDSSSQALRDELEHLSPVVHCYLEPRMWLPDARNYLVARASGSHVIPLDADDMLDPFFLEYTAPYAETSDIVYATEGSLEELDVIARAAIMAPTALISRAAMYVEPSPYNSACINGFEERAFWLARMRHSLSISYLEKQRLVVRSSTRLRTGNDYSMMTLASNSFSFVEIFMENKALFTELAAVALNDSSQETIRLASEFLLAMKSFCSKDL